MTPGAPLLIPVSWGELIDKITILEIKSQRLRSADARANTERELAALRQVLAEQEPLPSGLQQLGAALEAVNRRLWAIEDAIREKDVAGDFGPEFVTLARSVYQENDERSRLKRAINRLLNSALVEEKDYAARKEPSADARVE
jgi:hypothetical protein